VRWFAEHRVIWVLPSGERRPGRIAIALPEAGVAPNGDAYFQCRYVVEPCFPVQGFGRASDTMQALMDALRLVGTEVFVLLEQGVRAVYYDEADDPDGSTLLLLMTLGPMIRKPGDSFGVADPEGKIAALTSRLAGTRKAR